MALVAARVIERDGHPPVIVRSALERDLADLRQVAREAATGAGSVSNPDELELAEDRLSAWILQHIREARWVALVAEVAGRVVGVAHLENGPRQRIAHRGTLGMAVAAEARGKGIGRILLEATIAWARQTDGLDKVALAVFADNAPALALYQSVGFVEEGRRLREIKHAEGEWVDDLMMGLWVGESPSPYEGR